MAAAPRHEDSTRILLVGEPSGAADGLAAALETARGGPFALERASDWSAAEGELVDRSYDLLLLDLSASPAAGLALLERAHAAVPHIPILVLAGRDDDATAVRALQLGAQDYLVEGMLHANALPRTIRSAIQRHRILEELDEARRRQLELKDHFLSHVSHELRTPLTAIHQFVSLVVDGLAGELNPEQEEYLAVALRNVEQLRKMIGDLVDVTRAEEGKLSVELRPTELGEVVWDAVRALTAAAGARRIALSAVIPDDLPCAIADEGRVRQILCNLIDNAVKFTPEGGVVTVRCERASGDLAGGLLVVSVEDTGCGVRPEASERIFERLHQEQTGTAASRRGLGLGLYLCRELVTRQGGSIWVESEPGRGSCFRFTLPVFSLASLLEPILTEHGELREFYSLIRVDVVPLDPTAAIPVPESLLAAVEQQLGDCVLRGLDIVVPRRARRSHAESFFVVAATGASGMNALVRRIRRQLGRSPELKRPNVRIYVAGRVNQAKPEGDRSSVRERIEAIADELSHLLEDDSAWGRADGG